MNGIWRIPQNVRAKYPHELDDLETMVDHFNGAITTAYHENNIVKERSTSHTAKWWTPELENAKRKAKAARKTCKRHYTEQNGERKRKAEADYKKLIKKTQRESWQSFCDSLEGTAEIARLQKLMRSNKINQVGSLIKDDNTYTVSQDETLEEFMTKLFPDCADQEDTEQNLDQTDRSPIYALNRRITQEEIEEITERKFIEEAIRGFDPYKSPGPDKIYPVHMQKEFNVIAPYLQQIYRTSLYEGRPADQWLNTKVVFIPKPGKSDYYHAKSFRPISLNSFVMKGLERIILWYIQDKHLKYNPLNENLFSYRTGVSTDTAIHVVVSNIEKAIHNKKFALAVFLDISGAFSNTSQMAMINCLIRKGVDQQIVDWVSCLLRKRKAFASLGESEISKRILRGAAEGGILSPELWNMTASEALDNFNRTDPVRATGYADNFNLLTTGDDLEMMQIQMQVAINLLCRWAEDNKLTFSAEKTKVMLFTRRNRVPYRPRLHLRGDELEIVEQFKYLGVILDSRLKWTPMSSARLKKPKKP